jgi:alkylated DNA repair dioxygenase AlkB
MIPYVEKFLEKQYADDLFEFLRTGPHFRPRNARNGTYLRRVSYYGWSPIPNARGGYDTLSLGTMPEIVKQLRRQLTDFAGRDINYLSCIGYNGGDDHMAFHQHKEDRAKKDETVWVVSLGFPRLVSLRPHGSEDKSAWSHFRAAHGSLYVLPHEYNTTHDHAILDEDRPCGLRISINCKHLDPEYVKAVLAEIAAKKKRDKSRKEVAIYSNGQQSIYRCGKNCDYPPDAVYVGRKYGDRPDTPFRNYKVNGGYPKGDAWKAEVARRMQSPEFRTQVESLRGKNLLCWCSPGDDCHAKVWLELANAPREAENGK